MKLLIAGSRNFTDYDKLEAHVDKFTAFASESPQTPVKEIVSGMATGADTLGILYAQRHNLPVKTFPANWREHGKAAGPLRNLQMGEYADAAVIFWDGYSRGTQNMIEVMKTLGKPYVLVHTADPVIDRVITKIKSRSDVGVSKYSTTLAANKHDDFLLHLQQELMDAVNYIEKLMYDKENSSTEAQEVQGDPDPAG